MAAKMKDNIFEDMMAVVRNEYYIDVPPNRKNTSEKKKQMNEKRNVLYKITDFTHILPSGKEATLPGHDFSAKDDNEAFAKFDMWRTGMLYETGIKFGSQKPELERIETVVTKLT